MAAVKLALVVDSSNTVAGDIYIDPATGSTRLTATLAEEVAQLLFTRFRFFLGEWFLDSSLGLPWFQQILGIKNSDAIVISILRSVVTTCPGVASLTSFSLNRTGRTIAPRFSCRLTNGAMLTQADFAPFILAQG